jgi:hypothetical protein
MINFFMENQRTLWKKDLAFVIFSDEASPFFTHLSEGLSKFNVPTLLISRIKLDSTKDWYSGLDKKTPTIISGPLLLFNSLFPFIENCIAPEPVVLHCSDPG